MSFLSFFKSLGHDIGIGITVATPLMPLVEMIPGVGTIAGTVFNTIVAIDHLVTPPASGPTKKAVVVQIVNSIHPGLNQNDLSTAIDGVVSALNLLQSLMAKMPPLPVKGATS